MGSSTIKPVGVFFLVVFIVIVTAYGLFIITGSQRMTSFKEELPSASSVRQKPMMPIPKTLLFDKLRSKVSFQDSTEAKPLTKRNFTIVTAFFNLGNVKKAHESFNRTPSTYTEWMLRLRSIQNVVIAFFDDKSIAETFANLRKNQPTEVVIVNRSELWAFSLVNRTRDIFLQPDYPKNSPKSTQPEYDSAMHAKYELVARAATNHSAYGSPYIAWMDLGIYRELPKDSAEEFMLRTHACQRDDAIMFARIYDMDPSSTAISVMKNGKDWVAGGFFVATRRVAATFFAEYAWNVERFLNQGLANHDQSVLLSMYLPSADPRPSVPMQVIVPSGPDDPWFHTALQARRDALSASSNSNGQPNKRVSCAYEIYR